MELDSSCCVRRLILETVTPPRSRHPCRQARSGKGKPYRFSQKLSEKIVPWGDCSTKRSHARNSLDSSSAPPTSGFAIGLSAHPSRVLPSFSVLDLQLRPLYCVSLRPRRKMPHFEEAIASCIADLASVQHGFISAPQPVERRA